MYLRGWTTEVYLARAVIAFLVIMIALYIMRFLVDKDDKYTIKPYFAVSIMMQLIVSFLIGTSIAAVNVIQTLDCLYSGIPFTLLESVVGAILIKLKLNKLAAVVMFVGIIMTCIFIYRSGRVIT